MQFWAVDGFVAVKEDVDIEKARALGKGFLAAELVFDAAEGKEEVPRWRSALAFYDAVEKPGLVEIIDRLSLVEGGNFGRMEICGGQGGDGCDKVAFAAA